MSCVRKQVPINYILMSFKIHSCSGLSAHGKARTVNGPETVNNYPSKYSREFSGLKFKKVEKTYVSVGN